MFEDAKTWLMHRRTVGHGDGKVGRSLTCLIYSGILSPWELQQGSDRIIFAGCCWNNEREAGTPTKRLFRAIHTS